MVEELNIDDLNRVRILGNDEFADSAKLRQTANEFVEKMTAFHEQVRVFEEQVEGRAAVVEEGKLAVIGQRNLIQGEEEAIKAKKAQLAARIAEKQAALDRHVAHGASLMAVIREQEALLEKLSNNEA
ncbi:uncharacterized protein AMSG_08286 [Thecamonas trahens ATCC 50062]|uniref:Uncharacterized protein n=1 Tax=Thecamonas trahens ATCC 50062 TaxID=461836 RepID=A0A0L0DKZ0_THETB|nr:hypothetical protein AMSG_08286 [Thecamonas trahens ATCC 50062]KNC52033.1 hypothetical protein AMSG_08286 [Thecamonas trahens ATCC 50062]|eukprot:XP_013755616.1 hypothetical protein AMSG_08286 [Thecamonas trahens ATCC 50062]